jgi:hypothetical protein
MRKVKGQRKQITNTIIIILIIQQQSLDTHHDVQLRNRGLIHERVLQLNKRLLNLGLMLRHSRKALRRKVRRIRRILLRLLPLVGLGRRRHLPLLRRSLSHGLNSRGWLMSRERLRLLRGKGRYLRRRHLRLRRWRPSERAALHVG